MRRLAGSPSCTRLPARVCRPFTPGNLTSLILLLAVLLMLGPAASGSSYPDLSAFENAAVVPDSELAEMRGRFVEGGEVQHFGIQMFTAWQTGDGVVLTTGLEWSADTAGNAQTPTISLLQSLPDGTIVDPGAGQGPISIDPLEGLGGVNPDIVEGPPPVPLLLTANAGGLETASGVVQSVQAAGDANSIGNDMRFNVTEGQVAVSFAPPPTPLGQPLSLLETTTVEFDDGTRATAFIEPNSIGYVVRIDDFGTVLQEVRGGVGRVAQHANIRSDLNVIRNTVNINFGLAPSVNVLRANVRSVFNLTRDLRR